MPDQDLSELITEMEKLNMAVMVNLSELGLGDSVGSTRVKESSGQ